MNADGIYDADSRPCRYRILTPRESCPFERIPDVKVGSSSRGISRLAPNRSLSFPPDLRKSMAAAGEGSSFRHPAHLAMGRIRMSGDGTAQSDHCQTCYEQCDRQGIGPQSLSHVSEVNNDDRRGRE